MKFERHHEILKRLSKFGSVKVSDLSNSLNVTKETIRSDLNELARLGYLTRCHGGAFIVLDSLDTIAKNEIAYALENYDTAGNDSNLLIVFYVQIMPDDFVMQLHRF
ncbi:hypothetical protein SK73_02072 [Escherichia coli]|nr:hypothetical protein A1SK_04503 [Escherichia coli KTE56]KLX35788.1 hypothetical protein SK73_02072 [Escherichia coli]